MSSNDQHRDFQMALGRLKGLVGRPVMLEISPSVAASGELCRLNRLRLSGVKPAPGGVTLRFSSVSGDEVGELELKGEEVLWVDLSDGGIAFHVDGTFVNVWDSERQVKRPEYTDAELWKYFGMPAIPATSTTGEGGAVDQLVSKIKEFNGRRLQIQIESRRAEKADLVELLGVRGSIRLVDYDDGPKRMLYLESEDGGRVGEIAIYPDEVRAAEMIEAGIKVDLGGVELKIWDAEYFGELEETGPEF